MNTKVQYGAKIAQEKKIARLVRQKRSLEMQIEVEKENLRKGKY